MPQQMQHQQRSPPLQHQLSSPLYQQQSVNTSLSETQPTQQPLLHNNNYPPLHLSQSQAFNHAPSNNLYMHSQPITGAVYHMLPAAALPSSVYVHNVTANVNLHNYPVPQYIPAGASQTYIPYEIPENAPHVKDQNTSILQQNPSVPPITKSHRISKIRGNNKNNRRSDYNHRQQQLSPGLSTPQSQDTMNTPQLDQGFIQYGYPCPYYGNTSQNVVGHPQVQQVTGTPLFVTAASLPMFPSGTQLYGCPSIVYHRGFIPQEYTFVKEKPEEGLSSEQWSMPNYQENFKVQNIEDSNYNEPPLTCSDNSNLLNSPLPIFGNELQEEIEVQQQQLNEMHISELQQPTMTLSQSENDQQENDSNSDAQTTQRSDLQRLSNLENINTDDNKYDIIDDNNTSDLAVKLNETLKMQKMSEHEINAQINNEILTRAPTDFIPMSHHQSNSSKVQHQISQLKSGAINNIQNELQQNEISTVPNVKETVSFSTRSYNNPNMTTSWTNQNKKNMASVAITATPLSTNNTSSSLNNKRIGSIQQQEENITTTLPQQTNTDQVKNQRVVKIFLPTTTCENEKSIGQTSQSIRSEPSLCKTISTSSIASTAIPQQLQNAKIIKSENRKIKKHTTELTKVDNQKKEITTNVPNTLSTPSQSQKQSKPTSWASLFATKSDLSGSLNNTDSQTDNSSFASGSNLNSAPNKKPIAKIFPFEGTSNCSPVISPTKLSYSETSIQGLVTSQTNTNTSKSSLPSRMSVGVLESGMDSATDEWVEKFANFLTKQKIDYSSVSLKPRGLTNRSNYCYINATLQALIGCPPFFNLIKSIPKRTTSVMNEKINTPIINAMVQLISEFSCLSPTTSLNNRKDKFQKKNSIELSCDSSFEPTYIYKLWNAGRSDVIEGRQEDAEEFLSFILNKMNDEMLEVLKMSSKTNFEQPNEEFIADGDDNDDDWQIIYNNKNKGSITRQTDFGKTPISDIFRGELRSRLQREGEFSVTDVIQPFFTLQLNIEKAASVKEALEILVGRDQLEDVTCTKTNQKVAAWQQMTLEKLPIVLILHLKCFDYKMDGCTKILKTVEFPIELKIDTKILASKKYTQKQKLYRLFAVVYHDGKEASKGHYIADVYHTGYSSWLRYDDSSVKPINENFVLRPRAPRVPYLLYYRRYDTICVQNSTNNK